RHTGVGMVLNTSFNNDAEPIVDTVADALNCFFTTDLDLLVVGDHLIEKRATMVEALRRLVPMLLPRYVLQIRRGGAGAAETSCYDTYFFKSLPLSQAAFRALERCLAEQKPFGEDLPAAVIDELAALWRMRVFACRPPA